MILDGVRDRCGGPDGDSSQGESTQAQMANDRGQVSDSSLETEVLNVSVGASHPAMVVAVTRDPRRTSLSVTSLV